MAKKRSKADQKLDKAVATAIAKTNAEIATEGLVLIEARCPKCGCPDVDLSYHDETKFKCWDCGEIYSTPGLAEMKWM